MSGYTVEDVHWFAENAHRQRSGPLSVWWIAMAHEWLSDNRWHDPPTEEIVLGVAGLVEPFFNRGGFREMASAIGNHVPPDWQEVPRLVSQLCAAGDSLSPDEWYREFEMIHPFRDGNGRTGALLWNAHRWRLGERDLVHPPDFFDPGWFDA
ncbi:hypothetical protein LCGC14_0397550 [marine sediment metagenome]|uniref:Fido domain-containing protein n=1 Tax=marine sediment metagenome TaxID=412755 RepID=A0A0F9VJX4_9ZZZZ